LLCPNCGADAGDSSKFCPSCGSTLVRARAEDAVVGRIIDRKYRVEALLGEGGMGKVYRAEQMTLGKPVVLKVLHHALQSDRATVERFQREARAASRLNHPNSISILDFGQAEDGTLFIAMELVAGKDLHHVLTGEWPLSEARIARILAQVLSALADAHGAGVIHRDLKPENIMVEQRRGEPDFVKVLDFGIAKIQDAAGEDGRALTRAGFVCGTPEYMSPEQARGAVLDARSDLYAVGVILYQLVTGLLPFESDSPVGFATKHLTETPRPPSQRRPGVQVSPAMEALILRALAKDPADRPPSAEAFRQELLALAGGGAAHAAPALAGGLTPIPLTAARATGASPRGPAPLPLTAPTAPAAARPPVPPTAAPAVAAPAEPARAAAGAPVAVKVLTGVLVAASLGLAGFYVWGRGSAPAAPAPVEAAAGADEAAPPYDRPVPAGRRDAEGARRLALAGDGAHASGDLALAARHYGEAFGLDPTPELSLKLGEVAWHRNSLAEARGWWQRHLRDHRDSRARPHIEELFPELRAGAGTTPP
jgi:serine/threonine-protein kinase